MKFILAIFALLVCISALNAVRTDIPASCLTALFKAALDRTNMYRARHHATNLTADATIAKTAQGWANYLSDNGKFEHNIPTIKNLGYGENIAWQGSSAMLSTSDSACIGYANKMVDKWYDEVNTAAYNYATGKGNGGVTGHFTQLVWKGSSKVGHGVAFSNQMIASGSGSYYRVTLVADYQAAGNMNCPSGCIQNVQAP